MATRTGTAKRRTLLKQARTNLITRTARSWTQSGRMFSQELSQVVQAWIKKIFKEAERDVATGGLLGAPKMPDKAVTAIEGIMKLVLAQGYWLQHIYMRECEAAMRGVRFRRKVTLSDIPPDDQLRKLLEAFINSQNVEATEEWHSIIPQAALDWLHTYTPKLAGVLEKDVLESVRSTIWASMHEGASLKERIEALKAVEPKIAAMAQRRVEAIARTEVTRADTMGRLIEMRGNPDVLGVEFSAVLDSRTTDICEERHGLVMRFDDPRLPYNTPPLHVNCRSLLLPATVYEYPDGLLTSHEFEEVPEAKQREEDVEEISKLLNALQAQADEAQKGIEKIRAMEAAKEAERTHLNIPQAKTIREANEIAVKYGIAENANFKGLDVEAANELIIGVARTKEMFPELDTFKFVGSIQEHYSFQREIEVQLFWEREKDRLREQYSYLTDSEIIDAIRRGTKKHRASENTFALAFSNEKVKGISLNSNALSPSGIKLAKSYYFPKGLEQKFYPVECGSVKATVDHEMGHQIDFLLNARNDPQIQALYNSLHAQGKTAMSEALSGYADTNILEFIAESWSEYMNNPEPRSTAREVAERLLVLRKEKLNNE